MVKVIVPKRRKLPRMKIREDGPIRCAKHLAWVRGCVCSVPDCEGKSRIEAAHVRTRTDGSMGKKPGDNWAIPLCCSHHRLQHAHGEIWFEWRFGIDMKRIAAALWAKSPHRKKVEQKR